MFSFGASSARSNSSSSSYGYSGSSTDAFSRGTSNQRVAFEDLFANLYGQAGGAASRMATMAPQFGAQAERLFSGGLEFLDTLQGPSAIDERLADPGTADAQIGDLGEDLARFFAEDLNPEITSRAVATGTLGGGRQGVAQGRAADAITREFARGSTAIRTADVTRRDQLAASAAQNRLGAAGVGLQALPGLLGVAEGGFSAELAPWMQLASVLGGPTVLGSSEDIASEISRAFGEDFSQSQSRSKSKSFSFGMGKGD